MPMHPRERLSYNPIEGRAPLRLPDGVRMVIWPVLALEEWDMSRPMARMVISPPQGQPQQPDHPNWTWHEYGMRVGFWRLKRMFEKLGISPTVTLNARVCETYPSVVRACMDLGWELNAHGYDQVSAAPSDGSTFYMAVASNFIALPELQKNFPVDVLHDFVPIGFVAEQPLMIAAAPSLGVNTLPELIALMKQRPGTINIAAGNRGSILHFAGEWLRKDTGTQFTLLHYAGGSQALPDILGGRVQGTIDAITTTRAPAEAGQLKALAMTSRQRLANFPNVPAAAETIPDFEALGWLALMAPPSTSPALAQKVSDDLRKVLAEPELTNRLIELGSYPRPTTPAGLTTFIQEQQRRWGPVIAETAKKIRQ